MSKRVTTAAAATLAVVVLGCAAHAAGASRIAFSNRLFRVTFGSLRFQTEMFGISLECPVTLEGSLHERTVFKSTGSLIGYISRAAVTPARCNDGTVSFLNGTENAANTLPWHIRFDGFTGVLPNIARIHMVINGMGIRIRDTTPFGTFDCLYGGPGSAYFEREATRGILAAFVPEFAEATGIPWHSSISGSCPGKLIWGGGGSNGAVTVLGSAEVIDARLVP